MHPLSFPAVGSNSLHLGGDASPIRVNVVTVRLDTVPTIRAAAAWASGRAVGVRRVSAAVPHPGAGVLGTGQVLLFGGAVGLLCPRVRGWRGAACRLDED